MSRLLTARNGVAKDFSELDELIRPKRDPLRWTESESRKVAEQLLVLRIQAPTLPLAKLCDTAQRVLPVERRRKKNPTTPTRVLAILEELGRETIVWIKRRPEFEEKLKELQHVDPVARIASAALTKEQRDILLNSIPAEDVVRHYSLDELFSCATAEQLAAATMARMHSQNMLTQRKVEQLSQTIERLGEMMVSNSVGSNGHSSKPRPLRPQLVVYGLPDQHHINAAKNKIPNTADVQFVLLDDLNPDYITKTTHRVLLFKPYMTQKQRDMVKRTCLRQGIPKDSCREIAADLETFYSTIVNCCPTM